MAMPSRNAPLAAISNAMTEESTSWYLPSKRVALDVDDGEPGDDTGAHHLLEAARDAGDVLLGHGATLEVGGRTRKPEPGSRGSNLM